MTNELDVLANNQDQLERQANHMRETRTQLKLLLDNIFSVSDPGFPLEPQLKAELQNYINQQIGATRDLGRFKDTDHNLTHAKRDINKVLRLLDTAMSYVPFDLFGGNLMDAHQAACLEGAKKQTYEVQRRLNVARQILPEIPHPGLLDVVTQNLLLNMQLNLNYVDVAWKAKAQHTYALLVTCQKNIETSLRWVRHYLHYTEGALQRLEVAIESTQNALEIERRRIVDGILAGQPVDGLAGFGISGSPSSTQEQGPQVQIDDQPPPMYESPPDANINNLATIPSIPSNVHLPPPSPTSTLENINSPALASTTSLSSNNSPSQQLRPPSQPPAPYAPPSPTTSSSTPPNTTHNNSHNPFR
ncbi:hypothetical protein BDC45DRAFT_495220 [Circinella umbellata]|nr:hypothetical protein BDC45DRAFT_495220 [Circinella umbellata]